MRNQRPGPHELRRAGFISVAYVVYVVSLYDVVRENISLFAGSAHTRLAVLDQLV